MIITLIRRWFSTGSSLIVKGTVSFFMEAPSRARVGIVAGSEERFSPMSVPVIKICEGLQASGVKSRELLLLCQDINTIYESEVFLSSFSAMIKELVILLGGSR